MGGEMTANDLTEFCACLSVAFSQYGVGSLKMNGILPHDINFLSVWLSLNFGPTDFWVGGPGKRKKCSVNSSAARHDDHRVKKLYFNTT